MIRRSVVMVVLDSRLKCEGGQDGQNLWGVLSGDKTYGEYCPGWHMSRIGVQSLAPRKALNQ